MTLDGVTYKQQKFFITVLEAEKSKIKAPANSVSGEDHFLVHRWLSWCKGHRGSWVSLLQGP